jgi:GNAT superfamily N-acetyltransferase
MTQTLQRPAIQQVEVRDAALSDSAAIAGLLGELGFPSHADAIRHRLRSMLAFGESVLVAEQDEKPVGVVTIHIMPVLHRPAPVGRLSALVVSESERGKGIGRALVAAAERQLKERGCGMVEVTSNQKLKDAHDFYRHLGYEETSLRFKKELR